MFANNPWSHLSEGSTGLFVDVGDGSTEITIYSSGKTVSRSFGIGTLCLLEEQVHKRQWKDMKSWICNNTRHFSSIDAIGSGGNINKIIKMAKCSDGKSIAYGKIKRVRNHLNFFSYDDRITKVSLKPDRADVIMPALKLDISVMKWGRIQNISAPQIGLAEGLVRIMYRAHTQSKAQPTRKSSKRRTKPLSGKRQTAPPMDIRFHWPGERKRNQHDRSLLCHSRS